MSSLAFVDLSVRYGRRDAIAGFTDTVRPGEWLCLIGPNGAGKSSILRATAGLVPPRRTHRGRRLAAVAAQLAADVPSSWRTCRRAPTCPTT